MVKLLARLTLLLVPVVVVVTSAAVGIVGAGQARRAWLAWESQRGRVEKAEIILWDGRLRVNLSRSERVDYAPVWAGADRLAWIVYESGYEYVVVWAMGSRPRALVTPSPATDITGLTAAPDGRLAWIAHGVVTLIVVWDGAALTPLRAVEPGDLVWRDDGRLTWWARKDGDVVLHGWDGAQVVTLPPDDAETPGAVAQRVTGRSAETGALHVFSPGDLLFSAAHGEQVALVTNSSPPTLWVRDAAGRLTLVSAAVSAASAPRWSPEGWLAWQSWDSPTEIYVWDAASGQSVNVSGYAAGPDWDATWSP